MKKIGFEIIDGFCGIAEMEHEGKQFFITTVSMEKDSQETGCIVGCGYDKNESLRMALCRLAMHIRKKVRLYEELQSEMQNLIANTKLGMDDYLIAPIDYALPTKLVSMSKQVPFHFDEAV